MHIFHPRPHWISVGLFVLAHVRVAFLYIIVSATQIVKLSQRLEVRFVIAESLFHIIVSPYASSNGSPILHAVPPQVFQIHSLLVGVKLLVWLVCHMVLPYDLKIYIRLGCKLYMIITQ